MNPYSPLRFYVAARWDDRDEAIKIKAALEKHKLIVTSTWLTPHDNQSMDALKAKTNATDEARQKAIKDFEDIDAADIYLVYSPKSSHRNGTGGKHVEAGYAMAKGKVCFLIGERENIFHYHPMFRCVDGVPAVLAALEIT